MTKHEGWTKYHIIFSHGSKWKFTKEGMKRAIAVGTRDQVVKKALYRVSWYGGLLILHKEDGTVDLVIDNWIG